jgi:hypothetical protein
VCEFCPVVGPCTMPDCEGRDIAAMTPTESANCPRGKLIQVGQVWTSPDTGNRFEVIGLTLGAVEGDGKVKVKRLPRKGQRRLPKWEGEGLYCFHASTFKVMTLESEAGDRTPGRKAWAK